MAKVIGRVLFLLRDRYTLGVTKLLLLISGYKDTTLLPYRAYAATFLGGPDNTNLKFDFTVVAAG